MADSDGQERTEQPTPKRLKEARDKGQVPRSRELTTMLMLMVAAGAFLLMGEGMMGSLMALMSEGFQFDPAQLSDPTFIVDAFLATLFDAIIIVTPFFILMVVVAMLGPLALGGWTFANLSFKWEKLDPVKGLKKIFSVQGLMELLKTLGKFVVVAAFASVTYSVLADQFLGLGNEPLRQAFAHMGWLLAVAFLLVSSALVVVALVDVPFQLWQHSRQLRMTRQEVRDELKDTEGKPEVRSKIRQLQREIARRRMMEEVPKADVIVTNPTHYAVALKYDQSKFSAPRVVAKGADLIAAQIRGVAAENGVPFLAAPPLARALYFSTEIGDEIPAGLYLAVAQVLAYIFQLKSVDPLGGLKPQPPEDIPVPEEFLRRRGEARSDAKGDTSDDE